MSEEPWTTTARGVARVSWPAGLEDVDFGTAIQAVSSLVARALEQHDRVEVWVAPEDSLGQRLATWAGMHREGVMRGAHHDGRERVDRIVYARLSSDLPLGDPRAFRSLLNSFLPRKRAISQLLVRDEQERVLMCQLTYKRDWDLPGGVVEVGESPQLAVTREVEEELGLQLPAQGLVLTDWLPSWSGWDDALCLVFDGGVHAEALLHDVVREEREIAHVAFCTLEEVTERAADFTTRRVRAALESVRRLPGGSPYTESGR